MGGKKSNFCKLTEMRMVKSLAIKSVARKGRDKQQKKQIRPIYSSMWGIMKKKIQVFANEKGMKKIRND